MAIYTRIQTFELKKIVIPYGLRVLDFTPVEGGNANSNYHIRAKNGEYMVTIMEEKSLSEAQKLASLLQLLSKHDFLTSILCTTTTGDLLTQYAGKPVLVKKWVFGAVYENLTIDMLIQLGNSIAELHQIRAPGYLPKYHPYGLQTFSSVLGENLDPEYESWLEERLNYLKKNMPENLPKGLIHGDIFFDNVLFKNEKMEAIIDFEEACHYYLIFDLGMAVLGLCRTNRKIDLTKARVLIKGYEQIRSLELLEKEFLQFFIEYAAIATSRWRFWKYNISSPNPDLKNKHWEMVEIAKEVALINKEDFL